MTNIAIYTRKSKFTGKGESIENQIKKCKEFIKFKFDIDPENAEIFIDEGFSGKNENRPQYQEMINIIKKGKINRVVIYQLNRLGRNARDIHNTMQMCDDFNTTIYSATEGFDSSTSFGRAIIGILASLAQLEREQLAERVKDNMYTLAKMGRWLGGQSPLGFDGVREYYVDENGKERSITKLKKNDNELKLVNAIYKKYLEEKSLSQVAKWSLTNNFKGKNGGNIDKSAINVILQNPVYVKSNAEVIEYLKSDGYEVCGEPNENGILRYGKNKDKTNTDNLSNDNTVESASIAAIAKHKGIIDSSDWLEVQNILKANTEKAPSIGKSKTALLTGLLKCSCGSNMQMRYGPKRKDGSKTYYYVCNMKLNSGGTRCDSKNLNGPLFEKKLLAYLNEYSIKELLKALESIAHEAKSISPQINIESIDKEIANANTEIDNLMYNVKQTRNQKVVARFMNEIEEIENNISNLEKKKEVLLIDQSKFVLSESDLFNIIDLLNTFNTTYEILGFDEKKKLLNEVIESITYDNKKIHIKYNIKKN